MLKNMIRDSGLETNKKLVNHSTRKHLVQKLVDNDIPPEIIQITGHKNVNSLNNYSSLSDKKQQQICDVLSNAASTSQSLSAVSIEARDYEGERSNPSYWPYSHRNPSKVIFRSPAIRYSHEG